MLIVNHSPSGIDHPNMSAAPGFVLPYSVDALQGLSGMHVKWTLSSSALPRQGVQGNSSSYELMHACIQAWPAEHEVEDSNPLPSSFDVQARN